MRTAAATLSAAGLAVLALAAPASAAYAPRLEARVDPATPGQATALTVSVRQAPGEPANRTEVARFPSDFRFNPGFSVTGCTPQQEADSACPETSRIGTSVADTELGRFEGPVFVTGDFRFVIFLRGFGGLVQQKVEGIWRVAPDGAVESILDGLPPVRSTFAEVRLDGGARSLVQTPDRCGTYPIDGRFTSHEGETATSRAAVTISGCASEPRLTALRARPVARRLDVTWTLSEAGARTRIDVDRRVRRRPWIRWRRVRTATASATAGVNRLRVAGRLRPGRYRVSATAIGSGGAAADVRRAEVTISPPRRARRQPRR